MSGAEIWIPVLIELINDAPAIAAMIDLSKAPPLSDDQMTSLQAAMDAAVNRLDADIAKKTKTV